MTVWACVRAGQGREVDLRHNDQVIFGLLHFAQGADSTRCVQLKTRAARFRIQELGFRVRVEG